MLALIAILLFIIALPTVIGLVGWMVECLVESRLLRWLTVLGVGAWAALSLLGP